MADNPFLVVDPPNYSAGLINFGANQQQPQQQQPQQQGMAALGQQLAALLQPKSSQSINPSQGTSSTVSQTGNVSSNHAVASVPSQYAALYADAEKKYDLPSGYLSTTGGIESGHNPNSYNQLSGAKGLMQFIASTGRQYGLVGKGFDKRNDPIASIDAAARLAVDDRNQIKQALGRNPTAGELYLAHQQGAGGAIRLLLHPDLPAGHLVGSSAISANAGNPNAPASQFIQRWTSQY